jgi:PhzF family phenazine biosynthesis protein
MKLELHQIDAFTNKVFSGNPACVVPLDYWLDDKILLNIAKENAVAETAFFVIKENKVHLRWFTPDIEMDLCGHATLATAHCLKSILKYRKEEIIFETLSGDLKVNVDNDLYHLDLPSRMPTESVLPETIKNSLSIQPNEVLKSRDFVLIYNSQSDIEEIEINRNIFDQININPGGVIVTAKGNDCDFVSRFFTPQATILEDPVTGSAHCSLTPYWSRETNKNKLVAKQLSQRGGELICINKKNRVEIIGEAITYCSGTLLIDV